MSVVGPDGKQFISKEQMDQARQQQLVLLMQQLAFSIAGSIIGAQYDKFKEGELRTQEVLEDSYKVAEFFLNYIPEKYKAGAKGGD
jgi:hypothetical protein